MTWTPKLPLCSKTLLYLPVFSLVGLGGGGVLVTQHVTWRSYLSCEAAPPHPLPPFSTARQKLWSLISRWDQTGLRGGGGEGCFLGQNHTNLKPLEKQRYLE